MSAGKGQSPFSEKYFEILKKKKQREKQEEYKRQQGERKYGSLKNRLTPDVENGVQHNPDAFRKIREIGERQNAERIRSAQNRAAENRRSLLPGTLKEADEERKRAAGRSAYWRRKINPD